MEDKSKQSEEQQTKPQRGSGSMLSAARKEQNKSVEEIAGELNLSLTQIRTIELDQSDGLPEPTYVRGYIRSYAKLLGLNPEEVLAHYLNKNWQKSANLDDMPRGIGEGEITEPSLFSPARVIVFIAIVGLLGFFWYSGSLDTFLGDSSQNTSSQSQAVGDDAESADNTVSTNPTEPDFETDPSSSGKEPSVLSANDPDDKNTQSTEGLVSSDSSSNDISNASSELSTAPESTETRVTLNFTQTSWVDIRDEKQKRLAYQSYPAGEELEVSSQGVLSILIGNAKGVQMSLNGQDYDLGPHTEGVYAKFSVGSPQE